MCMCMRAPQTLGDAFDSPTADLPLSPSWMDLRTVLRRAVPYRKHHCALERSNTMLTGRRTGRGGRTQEENYHENYHLKDDASAESSLQFPDRLSVMEVRLQTQEDEITLLKSSLADALRRLRLHDQQIPLLKQQLIAVNPAAARVLNQSWNVDGFSKPCRLSTSSLDVCQHTPYSLVSAVDENGEGGTRSSSTHKPSSSDRCTQTDPWIPNHESVPLALTGRVQSLSLEDALLEDASFTDETPTRDEDGDDDERQKDQTWTSLVEDHIHPTTIKTLHQQQSKGSEDSQSSSPQTPTSSSPAQSPSPHGGPLTRIQEGERVLVRRNSEKCKDSQDKSKQRLSKKAASSANLLTRSPSLESRSKELISSAASQASRRANQNQSIKMFIRGRPITIYGYRGRDCRANLFLLPSGEAVYFIACVVVLYHFSSQAQRHYRKHTDCVRCLAIHPDQVRVASGQTAGVDKDGKPLQPFVHIWDSKTLVTLQQIGLGTFERGVGSIAFSKSDNGTFLCVIDDSNEHMLSVWDWNKNIKQAEVKSTNEAVLDVDFSPTDTNNIISCGKSHVYFWTISAGTMTKKQGIFGKYKKPKFVLCFVFSLTGDVLTGDSEGNILTWGKSAADTKTLGKGAKETFQIMKQTRAHEGSVFTMCVLQGGAILSGGGKDRKIIRWSADLAPERECEIPENFGAVRTIAVVDDDELLVGTTRNAILRGTFSNGFVPILQVLNSQGHVDEMWGLATHPTKNIFLTCGNDRQVCVWNAEDHKLDWCSTLEESGLCADFCPNGAVVSVGLSTGSRWVVLDLQTKEVVSDLIDGNEQLSVMRYSPGQCSTCSEKTCKESMGHSSFITHLDWSKDGKYIMSNSGDYEILYWDIASGCKLLRNRFESKDREWASYTCVLGFHVMGVWLEGSDGTDINALCRSHNERMVAVADDFCKVHLFQYPCPKPKESGN
ncbi:hypothetical protein DNTS_027013 [Danionella cerebrum]|uniref:HELP domain-containing protein n=1 Tax=Danionella cerebrum TaxID=2873325 RepID=A0A553QCC2_9TELE|nr:hypothetical protein DNTS_027013 [Danionella translucida]